MIIIGIDPGLARVGYGVIEIINKQPKMIDCGIIQTNKNHTEGKRLLEISKDIDELMIRWKPNIAAVEKFFFYRSSTTISVVQARGVIMMALSKFDIPIMELAPMQVKLAITGYGKAQKDEVLYAVMKELKLEDPPRPDDAADALAIAITGFLQNAL